MCSHDAYLCRMYLSTKLKYDKRQYVKEETLQTRNENMRNCLLMRNASLATK